MTDIAITAQSQTVTPAQQPLEKPQPKTQAKAETQPTDQVTISAKALEAAAKEETTSGLNQTQESVNITHNQSAPNPSANNSPKEEANSTPDSESSQAIQAFQDVAQEPQKSSLDILA